jgi:hypothetical protein
LRRVPAIDGMSGYTVSLSITTQFSRMPLLYPRVKLSHLPLMAWIGVQGVLIAGVYGILHDQITFTISPEYFTEFKSAQFPYVDFRETLNK